MTTATPPEAEDLDWWAVSDAGTVGTVRRAATALGEELGLPGARVADLAIVAAELTSNLYKHATDGVVHLRALRRAGEAGVELVALDHGPGMADMYASAADGHSTAGTLGIGLGSIARKASGVDGFSRAGTGTVSIASVWGHDPPRATWAGGLTRPLAGESVCGDAYGVRERDGRLQAMLCDGLGHGPLAAAAGQALANAFREAPVARPAGVLEHLHRAVTYTRGCVAAVIEVDPAGAVYCASMGNIAGWVVGPTSRRGMTAQPGIVGDRQRRSIREYEYPMDTGSVVVLHSDGLTDRWNLADYPGLLRHAPLVVAGTLLRDAGVRRDDAGVLVVNVAAVAP
jgi:anti-sigma regulatory factor (Ser/Thr protein kinase)